MKTKKVVLWIVRILIVLLFLVAGVTKLMGSDQAVQGFILWGYPAWFMYLVGAFEVLFAILLLIPKTRLFANVAFFLLVAGMFYTHVVSGDSISMMGAAIAAAVLLVIHLFLIRKP